MSRAGNSAVVACALAAFALPAGASGGKDQKSPKPTNGPTIQVADDYYSPTQVTVKENTRLNYKWDPANTDSHNVILKKGPSGVKKKDFKSPTGSIGIKFKPVFEKKGTYDLLCTIHPDVMKMKVTVKK